MSCENYVSSSLRVKSFASIFLCGVLHLGERLFMLREFCSTAGHEKYYRGKKARVQDLLKYADISFVAAKKLILNVSIPPWTAVVLCKHEICVKQIAQVRNVQGCIFLTVPPV